MWGNKVVCQLDVLRTSVPIVQSVLKILNQGNNHIHIHFRGSLTKILFCVLKFDVADVCATALLSLEGRFVEASWS